MFYSSKGGTLKVFVYENEQDFFTLLKNFRDAKRLKLCHFMTTFIR